MPALPSRSPARTVRLATFAAGVALSLAFSPIAGVAPAYAQSNSPLAAALPSFAPLVKKVMPAVVNVSATLKPGSAATEGMDNSDQDQDQDQDQSPDAGPNRGFPQSPFDEMLRRFFEQQGRPMPRQGQEHSVALGSGFIIDPSGYIVTNNHVVQNADKVTVIFQDNSEHPAKIIGRDTKTDLALLKIDAPKPLPYVEWGDSDKSRIGDWVLAIGNPFGLGGTVTAGIVSARQRDINAGPYDDFLQTDAAINRGNSGGPMFDVDGKVIGINTAIFSPSGGSIGIGFALPSSLAKGVIDQLRQYGHPRRGWLGVRIQSVTPELAEGLKMAKPMGALIAAVTDGGPADKAGIRQGDVVIKFNGQNIDEMRHLPRIVAETNFDTSVPVVVLRQGKEMTFQVKVGELDETAENKAAESAPQPSKPKAPDASKTILGLSLAEMSEQLRQRYNIADEAAGVVVLNVDSKSNAAGKGLKAGDVIVEVDQNSVTTPADVEKRVAVAKSNGYKVVTFLIYRQGDFQWVAVRTDQG